VLLITRCSRAAPDGAGRRVPERPPAPPDLPAELGFPDGAGPAGTVTVGVRIPPSGSARATQLPTGEAVMCLVAAL
jgi:hypothetical protein